MVNFVAFNMNSREGTHRAEVFTGTAADAATFIDSRNERREIRINVFGQLHLYLTLVNSIDQRYHLNGTYGTMAFAVSTLCLSNGRDTLVGHNDGMAYLDARLLYVIDGLDGSCGAHITASCTLRTTVAALE